MRQQIRDADGMPGGRGGFHGRCDHQGKGGQAMKKLYIDVMTMGGAKHYCSLVYLYNPLFKLDISDVERYVMEKRPTLKYRKDVVLVIDNKRL